MLLGRLERLQWPVPPCPPTCPLPRGWNSGAVGLNMPGLNNPAKQARRERRARTTDGVIGAVTGGMVALNVACYEAVAVQAARSVNSRPWGSEWGPPFVYLLLAPGLGTGAGLDGKDRQPWKDRRKEQGTGSQPGGTRPLQARRPQWGSQPLARVTWSLSLMGRGSLWGSRRPPDG